MTINLPPLRERGPDILVMAKSFMEAFARENDLGKKSLSADAQEKLLSHSYPGNVRELKAVVELAVVMSDDDIIKASDINLSANSNDKDFLAEERSLKEYTTAIIQRFLDKYDNNVLLVADKLDIGKSTIYRMIQNNELTTNS
ncbi:hypothetical protein GCM10028895_06460 [Pontibacter rugosus]